MIQSAQPFGHYHGTIVDAKTMVAILRLKSGTLDHLND